MTNHDLEIEQNVAGTPAPEPQPQPAQLPAVTESSRFISLIERCIENPAFDADKLEKMLDMQERIMKKNAEMAFNSALSRLSADMPRIVKKNAVKYKNKDTGKLEETFRFANYEDIDEKLRPLLAREGLHPSYDTAPRPGEGGGVIVTCTLLHKDGHSMKASVPVALDSGPGRNNIQAMGSSISYGKRYALCMLLNIVTVGEDDDAQGAHVLTEEQVKQISALVKETNSDEKKFLEFAGAESIEKIKATEYDKCLNMLNAKKAGAKTTTATNPNAKKDVK